MNLPDESLHALLDRLTLSRHSFALFRLPWTDECHLVLQSSCEAEQLTDIRELNGKRGFVMAPFRSSDRHPLVLIRPDLTTIGWAAIGEALTTCDLDLIDRSANEETDAPLLSEAEARRRYAETFKAFIEALQQGQFVKLVLSRSAVEPLPRDFSPLTAFVSACNSYPRMMISLCHTPSSGTWIGSTPEILLSGQGSEWHTVALAGTQPMQGEAMPTEWSEKNRKEQGFVVEYIRQTLRQFGCRAKESEPYAARAGQLAHLKTDFHFTLPDTSRLGDLLSALHPTPAVCGLPKAEALRFITEQEGHDRRYYAGAIGWLNPEGQTDLYVNLRCMELRHDHATLYAGGGILPSSRVEAEWEETEEKMQTMRCIIHPEKIAND